MKRHRIGYTLWPANFDLLDPGPFLDEAEELGVDTVEIPLFAARLIADGAILEPAMRIFEGRTQGRRLGYTTHALLSINLMDAPERIKLHERLARTCIEVTARLGASNMVLHCGLTGDTANGALEAAYARQRESLARLGDFAARHEVLICLETIWSFDGRETALPGRLAAEIRAVGHDAVRVTLDFAHAALQCDLKGANLMAEIAEIAPLSPHLHLNDCFGTVVDGPISLPGEALAYGNGDLHLPLGWGSLPWDQLLTGPAYPDEVILNDELHPTYWCALGDDVAEMRRLAGLMERRNGPA
ncbi:MAG: sugar phosphate isomerase/epimerase [Proteobacteria bacterium]|nr:sugar phosphate isomerase/epimerase [Pseudomonadota bacterium]